MTLDSTTQGALLKKRAQETSQGSSQTKRASLKPINPTNQYKPSVYVDSSNPIEMSDGTLAVRKEIIISPSIKGKDYLKWKERIERQIEIGEKLHHPHHTSLLHHEREGRVYNLYYKLAPGKNLENLVQSKDLTTDDILTITGQIASALDHGHNLRPPVYHNDITPGNVHYDLETKHATLYDHDAATAEYLNEDHFTTRVLGTHGYVAPEVREGEMPTSKSDVYGLGCLLKHMLTGENPSKVKDRTLKRRANNDQLVDLVHKMTDVNPNRRPSASEVIGYVEKIKNCGVEEVENKSSQKVKSTGRMDYSFFRNPLLIGALTALTICSGGIYLVEFTGGNPMFPRVKESVNYLENQIEIENNVKEKMNYNQPGDYDVGIRESINYVNEYEALAPGLYQVSEDGELNLVNEDKIYHNLDDYSIPEISDEDLLGLSVFNLMSNENFDLMMRYTNIPESNGNYPVVDNSQVISQAQVIEVRDVNSELDSQKAAYKLIYDMNIHQMFDMLSLISYSSSSEN